MDSKKMYRGREVLSLQEAHQRHLELMRKYSKTDFARINNRVRNRNRYYQQKGKSVPTLVESMVRRLSRKMGIFYRRRAKIQKKIQ